MLMLGLKLLGFLGGSTFGSLISGVTDVMKNKTNAEMINNQTGAKLGLDYLMAVNETNRIKAEHQTERQVIFGLFMFALPCGVVWWAALLDGLPFFGHEIGSWRIAVPPGFAEAFLNIVNSFFVAAPSLAAVAMLSRVFKK